MALKQRKPMKRTAFRRIRAKHEPAVPREDRPTAHVAPTVSRGTYAVTGAGQAQPKRPADRLQALRDLAKGESCAGVNCRCQPDTTVWAHSNEGAQNKGLGYKANDSSGAFLGRECHDYVDGRDGSKSTQEQRVAVMRLAQMRTRERLREIAGSRTEKLWKVRAARWALDQLNATPVGETA